MRNTLSNAPLHFSNKPQIKPIIRNPRHQQRNDRDHHPAPLFPPAAALAGEPLVQDRVLFCRLTPHGQIIPRPALYVVAQAPLLARLKVCKHGGLQYW